MITKRRLTRIAPRSAANILGILYGFLGLIFSVVLLIPVLFGKARGVEVFVVVISTPLYAVIGFVMGLIFAALYNLVARWTGGFEFEFHDENG